MGIIGEIAGSLGSPTVLLGGLILAVLMLTQETKFTLKVFAGFVVLDWIVWVSKFEVEANHGVYLGPKDDPISGDRLPPAPLTDPGGIPLDQYHLAAVQLGGAILVGLIIWGGLAFLRARLSQQPGGLTPPPQL